MIFKIRTLKEIKNTKGNILKVLSSKDIRFKKFGETYLTKINKRSVKAWKKHKKMHLNLTVISGEVKFVIYSEVKKIFKKIILKGTSKKSIYIPPGNWFGFMGLSKKNVILSITSELTSEKEIVRREIKDIKYYW